MCSAGMFVVYLCTKAQTYTLHTTHTLHSLFVGSIVVCVALSAECVY